MGGLGAVTGRGQSRGGLGWDSEGRQGLSLGNSANSPKEATFPGSAKLRVLPY
jgi:hypothetical protein